MLLPLIYHLVNVISMETLKEIKLLKPENRFDRYMEQKENIKILLKYVLYFIKLILIPGS